MCFQVCVDSLWNVSYLYWRCVNCCGFVLIVCLTYFRFVLMVCLTCFRFVLMVYANCFRFSVNSLCEPFQVCSVYCHDWRPVWNRPVHHSWLQRPQCLPSVLCGRWSVHCHSMPSLPYLIMIAIIIIIIKDISGALFWMSSRCLQKSIED